MDAYGELREGVDDDEVVPWDPADDDLLPGRMGRIGRVVLPPPLGHLPPPPMPAARPAPPAEPPATEPALEASSVPAEALLMPAAAAGGDGDRDFWGRGLAPLADFSDVRALPDQPIDY